MDASIRDHIDDIERSCGDSYDVYFLCDNTKGVFDGYENKSPYHLFVKQELLRLEYPGKVSADFAELSGQTTAHHKNFNFPPGYGDLPILSFYLQNPNYQYYWVVEYDVRFTGEWQSFFKAFENSESDLLGTTLTRYEDVPDWFHWSSLRLNIPLDQKKFVRGFFPIYRMSGPGFAFLDKAYREGVAGHYEGLFPTLLEQAGFQLEDVGGDGEFVRAGNNNRFYDNTPDSHFLNPGTFVFRPAIHRPGRIANKLWHPVKRVSYWRAFLIWLRNILPSVKKDAFKPTR